jgi:A/G-specific adenine glycosylase
MHCGGAAVGGARQFSLAVVEWYRERGDRNLPWRVTRDPWAVLVAGVLLRRTTARQVLGVYGEFLRRWPSPRELAAAPVKEVERALRPLGMERVRARQLKRLAAELLARHGGWVPLSLGELVRLTGVGDYTAREVLVAVLGAREPLLDTNAVRVLWRALGVRPRSSRPYLDPEFVELARSLVPPGGSREYNFGLLDLARKVCSARRPACFECPVAALCREAREAPLTRLPRDGLPPLVKCRGSRPLEPARRVVCQPQREDVSPDAEHLDEPHGVIERDPRAY